MLRQQSTAASLFELSSYPGRTFRSPDPVGYSKKYAGKSPNAAENTGNHWDMEAVFLSKIRPDYSGGFLSSSSAFWQELIGNHQKKSENFPTGILLAQNQRDYPEPVASRPDCSTWITPVMVH
ncbi:unnamed protein product [Rotaria socialis]